MKGAGRGFLFAGMAIKEATVAVVPEGVRVGDERLIRITEAAAAKAAALREREGGGPYLRVRVTGGGCNGLAYGLKFVGDAKRGDILIRASGVDLLVDPKSALYLRGMTLDYSDRLVAGGFKFSNPNAKASCSCGESFSV